MTLGSSESESHLFLVFFIVSLSTSPPEKVAALLHLSRGLFVLLLMAEELLQPTLTEWENLLYEFSNISSAL